MLKARETVSRPLGESGNLFERISEVIGGQKWFSNSEREKNGLGWADYAEGFGRILGVVSEYGEYPADIRRQLDALVASQYADRIFNPDATEILLEIVAAGTDLEFPISAEQAKEILIDFDAENELARAKEYVTHRRLDDLVLTVLDEHGEVLGTMTLYRINDGEEFPSDQYLLIDRGRLPQFTSAIEIGRFVSRPEKPMLPRELKALDIRRGLNSLIAYVVAHGYLNDANDDVDLICGDTHGALTRKLLAEGIPVQQEGARGVPPSRLNPQIINNGARPALTYFLNRKVLGDPIIAQGILGRDSGLSEVMKGDLERSLIRQGIEVDSFDPALFDVNFFWFERKSPRTERAFRRLRSKAERYSRIDYLVNGRH